jgi:AAHS family 4-hydroxybenzoate transporter-like MFS transporter
MFGAVSHLASEYAPKRVRGTAVAILWTLVPAGNVVGGLLASILMPRAGWESVYLIGGLTPLVAAALIYMLVPESVSFLVASRAALARSERSCRASAEPPWQARAPM